MKRLLIIPIILAGLCVLPACSISALDPWAEYPDGSAIIRETVTTGLVTILRDEYSDVYLQYGRFKLKPDINISYTGPERAMASLTIHPGLVNGYYLCEVDWMEFIEKGTVINKGASNLAGASGDGLDVLLNSGFTRVEDGFLSVHYNTWWGNQPVHHDFTLIAGVNPADPLEFELRQDSHSEPREHQAEGLICFDINSLLTSSAESRNKIRLNWTKTDGTKGSAYFEAKTR